MELSKYEKMKELFAPGRGTMMPGAHNALSARIIEAAGFETMLFTGAGFANTYLALLACLTGLAIGIPSLNVDGILF